jgi:hypothetical protein
MVESPMGCKAIGNNVFISGEIELIFDKEIEKYLDFFVFSIVNFG